MHRSEVFSNIDNDINNPLSGAEYAALTIVRALKPIQLGSEKLCCRYVTLLSAEGVFYVMIKEPHEQNSASSLKWMEALISILSERRPKTQIGFVKLNGENVFYIKSIIKTQ